VSDLRQTLRTIEDRVLNAGAECETPEEKSAAAFKRLQAGDSYSASVDARARRLAVQMFNTQQ